MRYVYKTVYKVNDVNMDLGGNAVRQHPSKEREYLKEEWQRRGHYRTYRNKETGEVTKEVWIKPTTCRAKGKVKQEQQYKITNTKKRIYIFSTKSFKRMLQITNKQDCCGCYACVQRCPKQCIRMESDEEGFEYPIIDKEQCINCGLCNKVCPQTNTSYSKQPINIYAIKHPDQEIQLQSSSGGAFSLIAEWVIQKGGVVFGAIFDDNWNVIHGYTESISGLEKLRMSKYVQSKIGLSFIHTENFLKKGKIVMFVGTPCQIHGLKLFLRKDYENLITVDFV